MKTCRLVINEAAWGRCAWERGDIIIRDGSNHFRRIGASSQTVKAYGLCAHETTLLGEFSSCALLFHFVYPPVCLRSLSTRFSFLCWSRRITRPHIGKSFEYCESLELLNTLENQLLNCLIRKWMLGQVPMCLIELMYWDIIQNRVGKDEELGHQRFANNAAAFVSRFFWPSSFSQPKAFNINIPPGLLDLVKLWSSFPTPPPRLLGSLDSWSEFLCFCVQSFWEIAACTDVMSLSPAPIICVFSLIIACGWQTWCQSPVHPKSFGEGVHYDRDLQW